MIHKLIKIMNFIIRKVFAVVLLPALVLSACGGKKENATTASSKSASTATAGAFEGTIYMTTTLPNAGTTDMKLMVGRRGMRAENAVNIGGHANTMMVTVLSLTEKPGKVYMINGESNEVMELDVAAANAQSGGNPYKNAKIEKIGREKIRGFECTHVRITWPGRDTVIDQWVSSEFLDFYAYARMQGADGQSMTQLADRLKAEGVEGFPVKMLLSPSGVLTELTKVERTVPDDKLFEVPASSTPMQMPANPHGY